MKSQKPSVLKSNYVEKLDNFQQEMLKALEEHHHKYQDTWLEMSKGKLFDRLKYKFNEFELTYDKDKLISLANLAMLLYIRMDGFESIKRDDMI